ncbi:MULTISPECIES: hypothetical protein [Gordonia]|uniref:Uncharacterized protein n=1 Tax=Gordonia amicalis TaxID=89053 RepID=A0AAE4U0P1_9ACTN|nr:MULTISPECIES: hypothetical protein [Gordonia]ATD69186.1 hypothetical protein CNO18_01565 [Gordonia sp. 1D]MCZ4654231.1 hypothetical protein [Gordonia amicalis]MDJ0452114.1 hypothetical protein [Gordonia amicalis]MDV6308185.1 hypothetical protein [Gordonia amicalis]MDV6312004.1 hypothetical protein [Gordonia amicalis]
MPNLNALTPADEALTARLLLAFLDNDQPRANRALAEATTAGRLTQVIAVLCRDLFTVTLSVAGATEDTVRAALQRAVLDADTASDAGR